MSDPRPPDWEEQAVTLIKAYNDCATKTQAHRDSIQRKDRYAYCLTPSAKNREKFYALISFCEGLGVNPAAWVFSKHAVSGWKYPVQVRHLFSKKFLAQFTKWKDKNYHGASEIRLRKEEANTAIFVPFRDLDPYGAEKAKSVYKKRGRSDLCMAAMDITYGYHPDSEACRGCLLSTQCKAVTDRVQRENAGDGKRV